jgi:hypothetical protein
MLAFLIILLVLALAGGAAVALILAVRRAPEGYENAQGYHPGPTPADWESDETPGVVAADSSAGGDQTGGVRRKELAPQAVGSPLEVC